MCGLVSSGEPFGLGRATILTAGDNEHPEGRKPSVTNPALRARPPGTTLRGWPVIAWLFRVLCVFFGAIPGQVFSRHLHWASLRLFSGFSLRVRFPIHPPISLRRILASKDKYLAFRPRCALVPAQDCWFWRSSLLARRFSVSTGAEVDIIRYLMSS
jgi:hypothetical protein